MMSASLSFEGQKLTAVFNLLYARFGAVSFFLIVSLKNLTQKNNMKLCHGAGKTTS